MRIKLPEPVEVPQRVRPSSVETTIAGIESTEHTATREESEATLGETKGESWRREDVGHPGAWLRVVTGHAIYP